MPWPEYEKKEDIPEAQRDMYEEIEGDGGVKKWLAKPAAPAAGTPTQEDLDKVQGALDKEREQRKDAEKKAKAAAKEALAAAEKKAAEKAGVTDEDLEILRAKIRDDLKAESAEEIEGLRGEIKELGAVGDENRTLKLDNAVQQLMLSKDVGVRGDRVKALFRLSREEFDLTEDGKPKLVNHPGKTVSAFLADDLKKQYPEFYKGTQAGGGGAGGAFQSDGTPVVGTTADDIMKNPKASLSAARASGKE
jgi:hypothetical protein